MSKFKRTSLIIAMVMAFVLIIGGSVLALEAQNVIFLIGDGMGVDQISVARYFKGSELNMDKFTSTGFMATHSADSYVTDSAAAGTALATGYKTKNGMISVTPQGNQVTTLLEAAKMKGKKVGLVSTTRITHATPASFGSHVNDRDKENNIASQLLKNNIDVLLGGGARHFLPEDKDGRRKDGKNLFNEAMNMGYEVVRDKEELLASKNNKLLGLFTDSHMSYDLDRNRQEEPSLAEMTKTAISKLDDEKNGFFLMVEGGRIDHAAHGYGIAGMVNDLIAFDKAVKIAQKFADKNPNTLIVVTADHETGGLGLSNGEYKIKPEAIEKMKHTAGFIAGKLNEDRSNLSRLMEEYAGIEVTEEEIEAVKNAEGYYGPSNEIGKIMSNRAMVGWTTGSHSAANVPVMAAGPGAEMFTGFLDNTDVARAIALATHYRMTEYQDLKIAQ